MTAASERGFTVGWAGASPPRFLPMTTLTLDGARDRLAGWHFAKESLTNREREILFVAEAVLRELDLRTDESDE